MHNEYYTLSLMVSKNRFFFLSFAETFIVQVVCYLGLGW